MPLSPWRRVLARLRRDRLDDELAEEMRLHMDLRTEALIEDGMEPAAAAREARRMFGNAAVIREETRDMWGFPSVETVVQDVRYGVRVMRKSPTFAATAVLSLAVGIGAASAVFSLADALLVHRLAVPAPEQLVLVRWKSGPVFPLESLNGYASQTDEGLASTSFSHLAYTRMRTEGAGALDIFGFADLYTVSLAVDGQAEMGRGHVVSGNYFGVLGVQPALGRPLVESDDRDDAAPAAVISHGFWQRRFGGSPETAGKTVVVNGRPFVVVGVMPAGFRGTGQVGDTPDVYVPLALRSQVAPLGDDSVTDPNVWWVLMMGRLKPGVRAEQAQPVLDLILRQTVAATRPQMEAKDLPRLQLVSGARGQLENREEMREPIRLMAIVVGIVLLVACANVANLLLARGSARARELTVRVAIGAPRRRVVRQLITEGLLLAVCGSALGLVAAHWIAAGLLPALQSPGMTVLTLPGLSLRVVAFTALLASACAVLFSLVPALRATDVAVAAGLHAAGRGNAAARSRGALSSALVITQVALSMVLVATAVLLVQSVRRLQNVELGFDAANVLLFRVDPSLNGYKDAQITDLYARMLERLRATPGVIAASASSHTLISNSSAMGMALRTDETAPDPGGPDARAFRSTHAALRLNVDPGFFATMGLRLDRGRTFDDGDSATSQKVAVVNRSMARQLYGTEDAIGRRFRLGMLATAPAYEVIGVVADARYTSVRRPASATAYLSYRQQPPSAMTFEVKTAGEATAFAPVAREVLRSIDGNLPLNEIKSQQDQVGISLQRERLFAALATWLGAVTLGLSAIGLYALLAYGVTRRTPEIGIRMALGAERQAVRWMILKQSLVLAGCGLVLGAAGAFAGTSLVEALLFEVRARDPLAIGLAAAMMLAVSLAAGYLPARRASRVNPIVALRTE